MKQQGMSFILRWALNTLGLWVVVSIFDSNYAEGEITAGLFGFIFAGLIFSIANAVLRPIVIILSLPAILLSLGLFMLVVNGVMVYVSLTLAPGLTITFWHAILAGIILSLINYIVSSLLDMHRGRKEGKTA